VWLEFRRVLFRSCHLCTNKSVKVYSSGIHNFPNAILINLPFFCNPKTETLTALKWEQELLKGKVDERRVASFLTLRCFKEIKLLNILTYKWYGESNFINHIRNNLTKISNMKESCIKQTHTVQSPCQNASPLCQPPFYQLQ
jgi:hypothetical protein